MIKVGIIGDSHFQSGPGGRLSECVRVHEWIANDMQARGVDVVLHSGDVFEKKSVPEDRNAAADFFVSCARFAPVVIVRGNHDVPGDLAIYDRLDAPHPICVEEGAGVRCVGGSPFVTVACLSWPRKAEILRRLRADTPAETAGQIAQDALRDVLRGFSTQWQRFNDGRGPRILLAHAMVTGSVTSIGQPLVGHDMELSLSDLALAQADFVALGHIHKPQDWNNGAPIVYTGSPRRTAYGELETKGYVLATFTEKGDKWSCDWQRIEVPAQKMILYEAQHNGGDGFDDLDPTYDLDDCPGADVRFRYTVRAEHQEKAMADAASVAADLFGAGAKRVKVEKVVRPTVSARAAEITEAPTTGDKLDVLWKARNDVPERRDAIMSKLTELEHAI